VIAFLIALLLTLSTGGDICKMGQPIADWYAWADAHPRAQIMIDYEGSEPNFWVYQDEGATVLFVFKKPIAETIAAGESAAHGRCARDVSEDVQS
jgi:hypothetical protein